jgi:hypothetical protein
MGDESPYSATDIAEIVDGAELVRFEGGLLYVWAGAAVEVYSLTSDFTDHILLPMTGTWSCHKAYDLIDEYIKDLKDDPIQN